MPERKSDFMIIKVLYRSRFKLLLITCSIGIIAAGITLLLPNKYSSSAAISIQRPEVLMTGEIPPLNTEALLALVKSTRVKWELFEEIQKSGLFEEEVSFAAFQRGLTTVIEREKRTQAMIPMVKLTVTTTDPEISMAVANHWAEVVLKKTKHIYQSGVEELGIFTTNIFNKVNNSLQESEDSYTEMLLESNFATNRTVLKQNNQLFSVLLNEVITLKKDISAKSAYLSSLQAKITEREIDGLWIGEVYDQKISENDEDIMSFSSPLASRILLILLRHQKNTQLLSEFEDTSQIEYKEMMIKAKWQEIKDISSELMGARVALLSSKATYDKLKEDLSGISEKVILTKAIGDDILWDNYLRGSLESSDKLPVFKTEISNVIYEGARKRIVDLSATINGLTSKISESTKERDKLQKELSKLSLEVFPLKEKQDKLVSAIKRDQDLLIYYENSYNMDRQTYEIKGNELAELEVSLETGESQLKSVKENISQLEDKLFFAESAAARQKRDVDNLIRVRNSLAVKAEEVALLKVSMENVSRSGTVLLYQAQADPIKTGPHRGRMVLVVILLTFLVASTILVVNMVLKEE